jgi:hypothetical protein
MLDYTGIADALAAVLAGVSGVNLAQYEVDERDLRFDQMPLIDVRPTDADNEVRAGQDYFTDLTFQCDIYSFDLSSVKEAATLRDTILQAAQNAVRANPSFHVELETSMLGSVEFTTTKDEDTGSFVAQASFQVIAKAFTDR